MARKVSSKCQHCDTIFEGNRKYCTPRCEKSLEIKAKGYTKFLKGKSGSLAQRFQKMIRAEYAAQPPGHAVYIAKDGQLKHVERERGICVCVTCGTAHRWDTKEMNCGHFLAGRSSSILLDESNVAPQCVHCNKHRGGAASEYRSWMIAIRGPEEVERLERLKHQPHRFTHDELLDLWFVFTERLKKAERLMSK